MKVFFKKIPLALSSLVLALFSLSNQINHYALIAQGIWFLASFGFILILGRLILGIEKVREDLHNPVIASAFASYFMAAFLFASRLPLAQIGLSVTWVGLLGLYIAYIIFFSLRFMHPLSLNQVFPSWFVIYVGPAISLVTVPASVPTSIKGLIQGLTGLATLALFPLVLWRMRQIRCRPLQRRVIFRLWERFREVMRSSAMKIRARLSSKATEIPRLVSDSLIWPICFWKMRRRKPRTANKSGGGNLI